MKASGSVILTFVNLVHKELTKVFFWGDLWKNNAYAKEQLQNSIFHIS